MYHWFPHARVNADAVFFKKANALALCSIESTLSTKRRLNKQKLARNRADQTKAHLDAMKLYVEAKIICSKLGGCKQRIIVIQCNIDRLKGIVKGNQLDTIVDLSPCLVNCL